ncbi:YfhO family protein [Kribbella sandramycini]|uniref:Putative membrane protein YfhO n=1 Tax=Kribbella sandramycini TaxID=60450 RepID=A0A7Y4P0E3_9ACTN|nr:putative membrane protein YfhO [Kribbella sandramycini]NOL40969.1 YfhO family protein [Kribbella sandramycini]
MQYVAVKGQANVISAFGAAAVFSIAGIIRGTYPFGDASRNTNDLGQQFIPMAAHLRDIVHGQANGDLIFNWQSGFGAPFFGDFMAYVGSTLSWIAWIVPRDKIDLALFLVATAAMAIGAGAMTAYLRRLRPAGPTWIAIAAGISYGAGAWAVDDGAYMTLWLSGMVAFPVLCLLCEWILTKRTITSAIVAPIVVALLWTSHFYTVYMATIGAAVVALARLLTADESWKWRITGGIRCALAVVLGIGLTAPLLIPTFALVGASTPSPDVEFRQLDTQNFLSRLLAGTEGVGFSPSFAVGTLMLLLALSFPFNGRIGVRQRVVWTGAVVATVVSMQVTFTHEAWHGFDTPNGSSYRQAFVIGGMLVILGWMSVSAGLRSPVAVIAPIVLVGGLYVWTWDGRFVTTTTRIAVPVLIGVALLAWLFTRERAPGWLRSTAVAVLVGAVLVEGAASAVAIDAARVKVLSASSYWGADHTLARELVQSIDDWPEHRTSPGRVTSDNDPMLIGGQGPAYYTSTIPLSTSEALIAFGFGYSSYGRATTDPQNPVVDAVFAMHGRLVRDADDVPPRLTRNDEVGPLVAVRPLKPWVSREPGPWGVQETAIGADVYAIPKLSADKSSVARVGTRRERLIITPPPGGTSPAPARLVARCAPGAEVYLWTPDLVGEVLIDGVWKPVLTELTKRPGIYTGAEMRRAGTADRTGTVTIDLRVTKPTRIPTTAVACLNRARLTQAIQALKPPASVELGGHSMQVRLNQGPAATVTLGVLKVDGWHCTIDGKRARLYDHTGLLAVRTPANSSEVDCAYLPPRLRLGLAAGAASLLGLLALAGGLAFLRRRKLVGQ